MVVSTEFYDILGVSPTASQSEIGKAFRRLVAKKHPDKNPEVTHDEFSRISKAYQTLKDPQSRAKYDREGEDGGSNLGGFGFTEDMMDLFGSFVGSSARASQRPKNPPRSDFNIEVPLFATLEDVYSGKEKTINYTRRDFCKKCDSTGSKTKKTEKCSMCNGRKKIREARHLSDIMVQQVIVDCPSCDAKGFKIKDGDKCNECDGRTFIKKKETIIQKVEPGAHENQRYTFRDKGHNALYDKNIYGDLILHLKIKPNKYFMRVQSDLYLHVRISYIEALFGFRRTLRHISGDLLTIEHSADQKPIVTKSIRSIFDHGMPIANRPNRFGTLFLVFDVVYPDESVSKSMTEEQRTMLINLLTPIHSQDLISNSKRAPLQLHKDGNNDKLQNGDLSKVLKITGDDQITSDNHKAINDAYTRAEMNQHKNPSFYGASTIYYKAYRAASKNSDRSYSREDITPDDSTDDEDNIENADVQNCSDDESPRDPSTRNASHDAFTGSGQQWSSSSGSSQNVQCHSH